MGLMVTGRSQAGALRGVARPPERARLHTYAAGDAAATREALDVSAR
ncbi:hypothetical protein GCM10010504_49310 [Streptomyces griseus]|nr:hypothetical protein GCM10010504_49310 [Streptomyces griseus]